MQKDKKLLQDITNSEKSNHLKFENIFRKPIFLAPILKYTVDEYKDVPIATIKKLIVTDNIDVTWKVVNENGDITIDDLDKFEGVVGTEVQSGDYNTINIKYDIKFRAIDPKCLENGQYTKNKKTSYIHIDIELEQVYNISKLKRGQYYSSWLIANQLDKSIVEKSYNQLEKTYSIWIFNKQIPEDDTNTILRFRITPTIERKLGEEVPIKLKLWENSYSNFNLNNVVFVRRENCDLWKKKENDREYDNPLFKYLDGILNYRMDYIDEFLDFREDPEAKKEVFEMIGREEFVGVMCRAEGRAEKEKEIAEGLFKKGTFTIEEIADIVKMPISKVQELKNKQAN